LAARSPPNISLKNNGLTSSLEVTTAGAAGAAAAAAVVGALNVAAAEILALAVAAASPLLLLEYQPKSCYHVLVLVLCPLAAH